MRFLNIFILTSLMSLGLYGQTSPEFNWTTISSKNGDFSVSLPSDFLVHKDNDHVTLSGVRPGVSIVVSMSSNTSGKENLMANRKFYLKEKATSSTATIGQYIADIHIRKKTIYRLSLILGSSSVYYSVHIASTSPDDTVLKSFLRSVTLNGESVFKLPDVTPPQPEKNIRADDLKSSQVIVDALKHKQVGKIITRFDDKAAKVEDPEVIYSQPFMILRKERPIYTDSARRSNTWGTVELQIVFKGDGDIGSITVLRGLENGLSLAAIDAAKKTKFLPAILDGKPIDVTKSLEYNFSIY